MRKFFLLLLFLNFFYSNSQEIGYGFLTGFKYYSLETRGHIELGTMISYTNIGTFIDYQINNRSGFKLNLTYSESELKGGVSVKDFYSWYSYFNKIVFKNLEVTPLFNYDLNNSYNKGAFLSSGIRLNFLLDNESNKDKEMLEGFFNKTQFGLLLGGGTTLNKYLQVEILTELGLNNVLNNNIAYRKYFGAHLNLNIKLDKLLKAN